MRRHLGRSQGPRPGAADPLRVTNSTRRCDESAEGQVATEEKAAARNGVGHTRHRDRLIPRRGDLSAMGQQLGPLVVIVVGLIAYSNSFNGVFILDDLLHIVGNTRIQHLWPPWDVMAHRSRPVVELSLAINYALGGLNPWGYHAFNLAVHLLAGLALLGIVRRMLQSDRFQGRYTRTAPWLAAAVATIWVVHPLQTESVTYIIQRAESLMGLFFLVTLYCTIRGAHSSRPRAWYTAAVCACLLGMGSKEVMVSAPILVLLYDRLFLAASFKDIVRKRWPLYVSLAATWLVLGVAYFATMSRQARMGPSPRASRRGATPSRSPP